MQLREVKENRRKYMKLLLLADEQESMINQYLQKGNMYILDDNGTKGECIVTDENNGICEIKNIAILPEYQGQGYGKALIDFITKIYMTSHKIIQVGTGDSPLTISFYKKCGFEYSHTEKDFFILNYDKPIYECGKQLKDMIYLRKELNEIDDISKV